MRNRILNCCGPIDYFDTLPSFLGNIPHTFYATGAKPRGMFFHIISQNDGCSQGMLFVQYLHALWQGQSSVLCEQANEILLLGHKLTAREAYERGLVTRVFPTAEFQDKVKEIVTRAAQLPPKVSCFTYKLQALLFMVALYYTLAVPCQIKAVAACSPTGDTTIEQQG